MEPKLGNTIKIIIRRIIREHCCWITGLRYLSLVLLSLSTLACSAQINFTDRTRKTNVPHEVPVRTPYEFDYTISCPRSGGCEQIVKTFLVKEIRIEYPSLDQYPGPQDVYGTPEYVEDLIVSRKLTGLYNKHMPPVVELTKPMSVRIPTDIQANLNGQDVKLVEDFIQETSLRVRGRIPSFSYAGYYTLTVTIVADGIEPLTISERLLAICPRPLTMPVKEALATIATWKRADAIFCSGEALKRAEAESKDFFAVVAEEESRIGRKIMCHPWGSWEMYDLAVDLVCAGPPVAADSWEVAEDISPIIERYQSTITETPQMNEQMVKALDILKISRTIYGTVSNSAAKLNDATVAGKVIGDSDIINMATDLWSKAKSEYEHIRFVPGQ